MNEDRRPSLVLASASPRRRELLTGLGLDFTVRPSGVDESPQPGESPADCVRRLAAEKAAAEGRPGELVLAADTIVVIDGEMLGKPRDPGDARRMLRQIAGRRHQVLTGVALFDAARTRRAGALASSHVEMARMSDEEIAWYVSSGEPLDKAGAYAIQGLGALFVAAVHGNYTNVVGLPLPTTYRLFAELGYALRDFLRPRTGEESTAPPSPR